MSFSERELWLEQRKKGIGGSDASAVMGLNPYKSNIELWEEKLGIVEPEDISNKDCVVYGNHAEEPLRQLFALDHPQYEVTHKEFKVYQHKEYPFLQASLDGLLKDQDGRVGILEIKTTEILRSMQSESWKDQIPNNYYIQVLHYMNVMNADFAVLKAQLKYNYSDSELKTVCRHYHIERSEVEEDIKILQEAEVKFWTNNVQRQIRPNKIIF